MSVSNKWSAEHYNNKHHKTQQPFDKCELETKIELVKWIAKASRWKGFVVPTHADNSSTFGTSLLYWKTVSYYILLPVLPCVYFSFFNDF